MKIKNLGRRNRRVREPLAKRAVRFFLKSAKAVLAVSIVPLLAFSGFWFYKKLITTSYLAVNTIDVKGSIRVSKDEAIEMAGIQKGQNIFSFGKRAVEVNLKKNPWIKEVSIIRHIPDKVELEIKERQPAAIVKMDDLYVMDSDGVIFKKFSQEDGLDLPVVTGLTAEVMKEDGTGLEEGLLELVRVLNGRKGFNARNVSEIHIDPTYGFAVYTLEDGVRLDLGVSGFEEKLETFERIVRARDGQLKGIEEMDLNGDHQAIVRFTANVVKEGGAI